VASISGMAACEGPAKDLPLYKKTCGARSLRRHEARVLE
jgi:hypothetical protein